MAQAAGGGKIREALEKIARNLSNAKSVEVGFLEGSTYPDGTSVPLIAMLNEYGHVIMPPGSASLPAPARASLRTGQVAAGQIVPPRPYFRRMIAAKSKGWSKGLAVQLKENDYNAHAALDKLGAVVKGQLQESINELRAPPLAPSTVAKKGFDKPLIDTSVMINSADYRVKE